MPRRLSPGAKLFKILLLAVLVSGAVFPALAVPIVLLMLFLWLVFC